MEITTNKGWLRLIGILVCHIQPDNQIWKLTIRYNNMDEFSYDVHCTYYDNIIVTRYGKDSITSCMDIHFFFVDGNIALKKNMANILLVISLCSGWQKSHTKYNTCRGIKRYESSTKEDSLLERFLVIWLHSGYGTLAAIILFLYCVNIFIIYYFLRYSCKQL